MAQIEPCDEEPPWGWCFIIKHQYDFLYDLSFLWSSCITDKVNKIINDENNCETITLAKVFIVFFLDHKALIKASYESEILGPKVNKLGYFEWPKFARRAWPHFTHFFRSHFDRGIYFFDLKRAVWVTKILNFRENIIFFRFWPLNRGV